MFSDAFGLTQAVLEGRKSMTRRIIKSNDADADYDVELEYNAYMGDLLNIGVGDIPCSYPSFEDFCISKYSRYHIGEVVAVAQSYNDIYEELKRTHGSSSSITREFFHKYIQGGRMPVSNKMFVKADLMPRKIKITDIKVERLQDISDEDALMEGVRVSDFSLPQNKYFIDGIKRNGNTLRYKDEQGWHTFRWQTYENAINCFAALIDKVSGKGTWERNPWVFAYTFELVK